MDTILDETWREIFEREADLDQRDEDKRKKVEAEKEDEQELEQLQSIAATNAELTAFRTELDDYDTRTVHALMLNGEALDRVRQDLDRMLDNAYVLPDGRRVFKTTDGSRVFDERGAAVSAQVVQPNAIPDKLPTWEAFKAETDEQLRLQSDRHELLAFQAKLDHARERVGKGDSTKKQLDELSADLAASAPPGVKRGHAASSNGPDTPERLAADEAPPFATWAQASADTSHRIARSPTPM